MLELTLAEIEVYNEETNEFLLKPALKLSFEHSLVSVSKWESIHKKPFLSEANKTHLETLSYYECMCLTPGITKTDFAALTMSQMNQLNDYITEGKSATTINRRNQGRSREIITTELIYYWMVSSTIPFEPAETWHLSRLLMLIEICAIKNQPKKKMSRSEAFNRQRTLNAQRRESMGSSG